MGREIKKDGSFARQKNRFHKPFGRGEGDLPVEKGRYRLIWAAPCPWSHRAVIVRKLLGLEDAFSVGMVDPIRPKVGRVDWAFTLDEDGVDPVLGVKYLSELYINADPNYSGRPTVPAMVDVKTKEVVNNDYFQLTNYFSVEWAAFHKKFAPKLYPKDLREKIDKINDDIFHNVNNAVYECGFARSQEAYEKAFDKLFTKLDELEKHLAKNRFLLGDFITEADVRLYVTLARFDVAYYSHFKANKKRLIDYPNLWAYARELYHTSGFGDTTDFSAIKNHYYISARLDAAQLNSDPIVPKGPDLSVWEEKADRSHLSEHEEIFLYE